MSDEYSLSLALLDFVPNLAFLAGGYYLVKTVKLARGQKCAQMCFSGWMLVFMGGLLKATWKLLYTLGIADIQVFSQAQFVLLAPGFLALLVSTILLARSSTKKVQPVAYVIAAWKIPLLAVMTLSSLGAQGILSFISFRRKAPLAGFLFIIAVLCMLAMSGMASGSEQSTTAQWAEEIINSVGQISFAIGCYHLHNNYLTEKVA